jgi:hypothetical protein
MTGDLGGVVRCHLLFIYSHSGMPCTDPDHPVILHTPGVSSGLRAGLNGPSVRLHCWISACAETVSTRVNRRVRFSWILLYNGLSEAPFILGELDIPYVMSIRVSGTGYRLNFNVSIVSLFNISIYVIYAILCQPFFLDGDISILNIFTPLTIILFFFKIHCESIPFTP